MVLRWGEEEKEWTLVKAMKCGKKDNNGGGEEKR